MKIPHRNWRRPWPVLAVLIACAMAGGIALGVIAWRINSYDENIRRIPGVIPRDADRPPNRAGQNWLLVGTDRRTNKSTTGRSAKEPTWVYGMQRTDSIMIAHLGGERESVDIVSLPRDSWVAIPGVGRAKLNAAFERGGEQLLIQAVERLTSIRIDHLMVIDFAGFKRMTDSLGGVDVTITREGYDAASGTAWRAGPQHLDGEGALKFVRNRHGLPRGDFDRIRRQQVFLRAMASKVSGNAFNPVIIDRFLTAITESINVDDQVDSEVLRSTALRVAQAGQSGTRFWTAPIAGTGWEAGQSVVRLDPAACASMFHALSTDRINEYAVENKPTDTGSSP